jgi:glutamyl-tRNA synthetase
VPQFAHLPLILAPNKAKLSKRKHGEVVSLDDISRSRLCAAAFRNFLALLGWSPPDAKEIMSRDELVASVLARRHWPRERRLQLS